LVTIHRPSNVDTLKDLKKIVDLLLWIAAKTTIVFPIHPRTKKQLAAFKLDIVLAANSNIIITEPLDYFAFQQLIASCKYIVTDSGGIQKEAFFLNKPCITLRDETEWVETVENGWNVICGADEARILEAIAHFMPDSPRLNYFGEGNASEKIAAELIRAFS
jgi:UDP-N-acetylglucosamine 2-epimerase